MTSDTPAPAPADGTLDTAVMPRATAPPITGFRAILRRIGAVLLKEVLQLRRDRISLATMITIPLMQLLLFGYAINTQPRDLPTAVLLQEQSDVGRTILRALENTKYFRVVRVARDEQEFDRLLQSGTVQFGVEIPANFERDLRRGDRPAMLVAADASDPVASGSALAALTSLTQTALRNDRAIPEQTAPPFEVRTHARYNPAARSQLNIVPGLLGTILTLTMLIFTALAVTRETERGTMETLLAMPISPVEIMLGKIAPYVVIGFLQGTLIVAAGVLLFAVPIFGNLALLATLTTLFIATNLSVGYTFSTLAQNQLQAMQMAMMYFLPNLLLSGFLFPYAGMPQWAQYVGETLPLTHYLRIVRAIMLKGATLADLRYDTVALVVLMLIAMTIAVRRFRRTLD
ncbi:Nitrate ABC transporter permease protein [Rhodovulum sp. PH10]|uniref:ABC transporter permease n=1 Tax=Rhodovulum sp. PH10 TaxID=1187851 RepID=UPI00027C23DA|nr:ABC transporter permease [Rhodovulum sp. PH10]EJW10302.1 Nitrate ABC transporter permease protein [Rhodovulum sp. PH10]